MAVIAPFQIGEAIRLSLLQKGAGCFRLTPLLRILRLVTQTERVGSSSIAAFSRRRNVHAALADGQITYRSDPWARGGHRRRRFTRAPPTSGALSGVGF